MGAVSTAGSSCINVRRIIFLVLMYLRAIFCILYDQMMTGGKDGNAHVSSNLKECNDFWMVQHLNEC